MLQVLQDERHIFITATAAERSPSVIEGPELHVNFDDSVQQLCCWNARTGSDAPEPLVAVPEHVVLVAYVAIVTVLPEHEIMNDSPLEAWYTRSPD